MKKMKILFFIHDLSYGGAEKVLVNLVNNMNTDIFDITLKTMFDVGLHKNNISKKVKYIPGLKHMFRGNSYVMKLFSPNTLYKFFIKEDYDIVVSYLEGTSARVIGGCPNDNTKKTCWIHIQLDDENRYKLGFRNKDEADQIYQKFDKLICVSNTVKESFLNTTNNKFDNIDILYNTNETDMIKQKAKESVEDVVFDKNIINICSVAKITETKGYDHLAHVHKKLIDEGLQHHIYILGVGEQRSEIEKYLKKHHLENTFTFLGFRDNPYKYVANCDLYVCSSHREGFSTAVTEALVVGTPVVSTLCSGAQELLGYNNEYGIVVENSEQGIYDGLKYMLTHKDKLDYYKQKAKERGYFFSTENTVKAVEDMLIQLLNQEESL